MYNTIASFSPFKSVHSLSLIFFIDFFLELSMYTKLALNSPRSSCLCFLYAGIKSVCYNAQSLYRSIKCFNTNSNKNSNEAKFFPGLTNIIDIYPKLIKGK